MPRSMDVAAVARPARAPGGDHRARTGRAAGTVIPAPIDSWRRSITSGRSSRRVPGSPRSRRRRRHRSRSAHAPEAVSAGTGPTRRQAVTTSSTRPTRASRAGSGARPAAERTVRPSAVSGRRRAGRARVADRPASRPGVGCGSSATRTATAATSEMASDVMTLVGRVGASTSPRARRATRRRRCTTSPPASGGGTWPTRGRPSPAGT